MFVPTEHADHAKTKHELYLMLQGVFLVEQRKIDPLSISGTQMHTVCFATI
jgi:hypothetical protein